jgi:AcrR family transcriptional regulator
MTARAAGARKRAYHHGDLSRALVSAALALVDAKGADAITLREVAAAAGVTHAAAYRHFADKTALLAAVAEEGYRQLTAHVAKPFGADTRGPKARIRTLAASSVAWALEHPSRYRVMAGPRLNEDGRFPSLEAAIAETFAFFVAEIESGQKEGVFRKEPARHLAVALWVTMHGFVDLVLRKRIAVKSTRAAVEYFEDMLLRPYIDGLKWPPAR